VVESGTAWGHAVAARSPTEADAAMNAETGDKASLPGHQAAAASEDQIAWMQTALSTLIEEFTAYDEVAKRMQAVCAEERQARQILASNLDRLMSLLGTLVNGK
jgi:hypothetical protein